ncbi:MAG TPA: heavy metal-binding domain-containing protein [Ktedonobacterales bacterium]
MISTTLAELPGRGPYEALGVVIGIADFSMRRVPQGSSAEAAARQRMEAQAESMGADAIIDVHLQIEAVNHPAGDATLAIALIGTAIKFAYR